MTEIYMTDMRQWEKEAVYREWLAGIPDERQRRVEGCRHAADKRRSLAGSLLVYYAFAQWQAVRRSASMQNKAWRNDEYEQNPVKKGSFGKENVKMEAAAPDFSYGSNGKPYFPDYPQFHFSISHSGNYAVCAASDCEVGVDIQEIRPVKASIAERFFTETERMQMERVTGDEEIRMLFRIWSAKESYVKLTGRGMAEGLQTFTADLENGRIWRADTACAAYLKEYKAPAHYVLTACGYAQDFEEIHIYEI